ncbi:MAG TPA: hypothetical protein VF916_10350 [Ktedonobacterales bacterium]
MSPREGSLTRTPSPQGISRKQIRRYWLILYGKAMLSWLLVLLLLVDFEVGIRHVPPDGVQVITTSAESGRTLSTQEITNARTVADFYARLNSLPLDQRFVDPNTCPLRYLPTLESYTVRFTRWGLPVVVATWDSLQCIPIWEFSSGGLPGGLFPHDGGSDILTR